jgi:hypothetical protein
LASALVAVNIRDMAEITINHKLFLFKLVIVTSSHKLKLLNLVKNIAADSKNISPVLTD